MFSRLFVVSLALICLTGCEQRSVDGSTTVYSYALWSVLLAFGGGVAAFRLGWQLRGKTVKRLPIVLMTLGVMLVLFVAPTLILHRVVVDDEHFTGRGGFWLAPNYIDVTYDNLRSIGTEMGRSRRNKKVYQLVYVYKDGTRAAVTCDKLLANAIPEILARARKKNVATP